MTSHIQESSGRAVDGLPEGMRFPFDPTLVPLPNGRLADAPQAPPTHGIPTAEIVFGALELAAGEHELRFECLGKSEQSSGDSLAVDGSQLRPLR